MSTLSTTNVKNPSSGSNNIVLAADGSTTITTLTGTTITGTSVRGGITSGTVVASTSGTSIDFTSIPSYVKRITVMFGGVSTSGTSKVLLQLGDSGGVETSGYLGTAVFADANQTGTNFSSGFILEEGANAAAIRHGRVVINLIDAATNAWAYSGNVARSDQATITVSAGSKALSGALDRVRITTVNGTDTFDAGSINILTEG